LLSENAELLNRCRALQVSSDDHGVSTLALKPGGELSCRRRLTGTLETGEQNHRWWPRGIGDLEGLATKDRDEFFVNRFDNLLTRSQ
jgi:hypothetical protein